MRSFVSFLFLSCMYGLCIHQWQEGELLVLSQSVHSGRSLSTLFVWSIRREYHSMELASGGSASSHESNSLKARYPLSATVCPVRRRFQRSFFAAGPHKIVSPIGVNQEGDTGQYCTFVSIVRNVVQYEEYVHCTRLFWQHCVL